MPDTGTEMDAATDTGATVEPAAIDGRTARSLRTRAAVVDALLALIEEGDLRPTGPRIAERAGVSLRSVFQHFDDLEALFAEAAARHLERMRGLAGALPLDGPFDVRLEAFVDQRRRVLEAATPVRRAALLQEPFSAQVRATRDRVSARAREEVARVFAAELAELPPDDRGEVLDALDVVSSWATWDMLRTTQRLSPARASRVVTRTITALLEAPGSRHAR